MSCAALHPVSASLKARRARPIIWAATLLMTTPGFCASSTNIFLAPSAGPSLSDAGPSLLRVFGALALVLGLFLGGAWLVRNGRFTNLRRSSRLNVLETRSLGARQAIYVVAYGSERFLIGSTPAGINLLSHLAAGTDAESETSAPSSANPSFGQALAQVLRGPKSIPAKPARNA